MEETEISVYKKKNKTKYLVKEKLTTILFTHDFQKFKQNDLNRF